MVGGRGLIWALAVMLGCAGGPETGGPATGDSTPPAAQHESLPIPLTYLGAMSGGTGAVFANLEVAGEPFRVLIDTGSATFALNSVDCADCLFSSGPHTLGAAVPAYPLDEPGVCPASGTSSECFGSGCDPATECCMARCYNNTDSCAKTSPSSGTSGLAGTWNHGRVTFGGVEVDSQLGLITDLLPDPPLGPQESSGLGGTCDGILGVAGRPKNKALCNSDEYPPTLLDALGEALRGPGLGSMPFTMCYDYTGGYMQFKQLNDAAEMIDAVPGTVVELARSTASSTLGWYAPVWAGMGVDGAPLPGITTKDYLDAETIFDSGTSAFVLQTNIYQAFQSAICGAIADPTLAQKICPSGAFEQGCISGLTDADLAALPEVELAFDGGSLLFPFSYVMVDSMGLVGNVANDSALCDPEQHYIAVQEDSGTTFGSDWMIHYAWYFDYEGGQIWVGDQAGCDYDKQHL